MTKKRLDPSVRRAEILEAAVRVAERGNYAYITRDEVGAEAGVTGQTVQHYFKTMHQLKRDVMRYAVKNRVVVVVAQGLIAKDTHALRADALLRDQARGLIA